MLHPFGASNCPRCTTQLVHEFDLENAWVLSSDQMGTDDRWLCPGCGYSQPVTYLVDRPSTQQPEPELRPGTRRQGFLR